MPPFATRDHSNEIALMMRKRWTDELREAVWPNFERVSVTHNPPGVYVRGKAGQRAVAAFVPPPAGLRTELDALVLTYEFDGILSSLHEAVA
jgi:hypothetical protein